MFFLNIGYSNKLANDLDDVRAIVILPQGKTSESLLRSPPSEFQRILIDPQLYLCGLDAKKCKKVCGRLATFPWFQVPNIPTFDSGTTKRRDWDKQVRKAVSKNWPRESPSGSDIYDSCLSALEFQLRLSCTHLILPSPLVAEREDEAESQAVWLDEALEASYELEVAQPLLATVALSDTTINDEAFSENGFLDTIVDQVTSREGIDGVYIVIMQSQKNHPFESRLDVCKAYYYLSERFSEHYETVLTNFADVFGLVCFAAGASSFATGQSHALRRLCIQNFLDESFGMSLPHFYSHASIAEPLSEADLDLLTARNLLRRIQDSTKYSSSLMRELKSGGTAANLPAWAENQNNTSAAFKHFITRLAKEGATLNQLDLDDRYDHIQNWLDSATANQLLIKKRLKDRQIRGALAPADDWLTIVEEADEI